MADQKSKTEGVPWRIPQVNAEQSSAKERWHVIAVSHETRKVKGDGGVEDAPITIALMVREPDGEMKTWEARGHWTLEQMQAMPEAK